MNIKLRHSKLFKLKLRGFKYQQIREVFVHIANNDDQLFGALRHRLRKFSLLIKVHVFVNRKFM